MNIDFDPAKILIYKEQLDNIYKGDIPLPIMLEIDPCNFCNFGCEWCSSGHYVRNEKEIKSKMMIDEISFRHILDFMDAIDTVQGIYWCGGGEPTLNIYLKELMTITKKLGIKNYITTNGSTLKVKYKYLVDLCDWIAVSVNSGSEEQWKRITKTKIEYGKYLNGLYNMCQYRKHGALRDMEINFKFFFDPLSYVDIENAYEQAIDLGFTHVTIKPVDMFVYERGKDRKRFDEIWPNHIVDSVNAAINRIKERNKSSPKIKLECGSFYGMFNVDKKEHLNFDKCWTSMMAPVFGADGWVHLCCVRRGEKKLVRWDNGDLLDFWNSDEHKKMVWGFDPKEECPVRCKMGMYNQLFQQIWLDKKFNVGHI